MAFFVILFNLVHMTMLICMNLYITFRLQLKETQAKWSYTSVISVYTKYQKLNIN